VSKANDLSLTDYIFSNSLSRTLILEPTHKKFANYASAVIAVVQENTRHTLETVEAFSVTLTSYAQATNSPWPYVTLCDFPARALQLADLAHAKGIAIAPIVMANQTEQWVDYSQQQLPLIYSEAIRQENLTGTTTQDLMALSSPVIFGLTVPDATTGNTANYYVEHGPQDRVVAWQTWPLIEVGVPATNLNIISIPRMKETFQSVLATELPSFDFVQVPVVTGDVSRGDDQWNLEQGPMESQLMQPIFDKITVGQDSGVVNRRIVGIVYLTLNWSDYFTHILPHDVPGLYLVLSSTCGGDDDDGNSNNNITTYTYALKGSEIHPLGFGDLHDRTYDHLMVSAPFVTLHHDDLSNNKEPSGKSKTCIPQMILTISPYKALEESFITGKATTYTIGVLAIFAFTSLIFTIYDISVRRHQSKVMARVVRQDRIVSDLFPSNIRSRLYGEDGDDNDNNKEEGGGNHHAATSNTNNLGAHFKKKRSSFSFVSESRGALVVKAAAAEAAATTTITTSSSGKNKALAELFPNCTVIFADIAGFTAWSSTREPCQVFALLESIYSAFDKIAHRCGVFKIETVGDCYVAVAGLPVVQEDHALRVAIFARDCLHCMGDLMRVLEISLGPDTTNLELRVGIHSGQVTGMCVMCTSLVLLYKF
jgi:hypothetical protein